MDQLRTAVDPAPDEGWYRIRVRGRLDQRWSTWFGDMSLTGGEDGTTVLRGRVGDQAALHGLIEKVRDLGLTLLEVSHEAPDAAAEPDR
ncbi:hypothetical protein [Nocardioides sp. Soil805]|uniref:hypothetical protein n=1 Tax=Nocardioides sp. Soil805 TaxID=1736416 RepID=UPI00070356F0|nr:hypothetical protein [Nocardioides sp. Soil805]KRF34177.1 hypothetical protein ASG94_15740 [Nocardioides sp. Soil805]